MALLAMPAPLLLAETRVDAQATIRADGVQLQVRRLPDAIELVIQDAGAGGALEQRRDGPLWMGELRTDRIRGLKSGPQSLAMPDAGMERITFDGTGRLFELKVTPVKGQTVPAPVVSSDGKNLVVRFEAPPLPVTQTARPNLSRPVPVPTPAFVPPLRPRAAAPPAGDMAVGSMVVFEDGKPAGAKYRRFRIQGVQGANDFAMLGEVLRRRFSHVGKNGEGWTLPNLVLIDGGKGQLSAAREAMEQSGAATILALGLAKENEEIFLPGRSKPLNLPVSSPGLQLLQRVRDEAHRFALGYHHNIRKREALTSALDDVPGIGPKRRKALLKKFGTFAGVKQASVEELTQVAGVTPLIARKIKEFVG